MRVPLVVALLYLQFLLDESGTVLLELMAMEEKVPNLDDTSLYQVLRRN